MTIMPHSFILAEDEGFKPPIPGRGYTGFRVQRIRSLCQSSQSVHLINLKQDVFLFTDAKVILFFDSTKKNVTQMKVFQASFLISPPLIF